MTEIIAEVGANEVEVIADVDVVIHDGGAATLQTKSVTPTESAQVVTPDTGYDGLSEVDVAAISPYYIGSEIDRRSSSDMVVSGKTVRVPAGYYSVLAAKSIADGTEGTPMASKGTVSNHSVDVTPSVTNTAGYISGSTKTGTPVTVTASELVSGSETKTANGTYDVTNLAEVVVNVSGGGGGGAVVVTEYPDTNGGTVKEITAVDISNDTVDAAHLLSGYTAHNASGQAIVGTATSGIPATHIKTLTVSENVNAFQFEYDSTMASYDYVFMVMDFELTSSDWLYYSAAGGTERYGYQLLNHKFVLFKFLNGGNIINLCIPSYNASSSSPASPMIIPSVGSMVKIRCYNANKYIKAGSTLDIWGMNNADF